MIFHAPVSKDIPLQLPMMLGHFLPWYTREGAAFPLPAEEVAHLPHPPVVEDFRHWRDARSGYRHTHHHMPVLGQYDSRDPRVIEWQIETALSYGVSGFILNWYGMNSVENVITLHWLRGLRRWNHAHPVQPFYYFLSLDGQCEHPTEGKTPATLEEDLAYVKEHLFTDAYLRRDGNPVFSVFTAADDAPRWRAALDAVWGAGQADLLWRGSPRGEGETGSYAWVQPDEPTIDLANPYVWSDPDNAGDFALEQFYRETGTREAPVEYAMAGVWPGFNNQLVKWAWAAPECDTELRPDVIARETTRGNTLDLTWQVYLRHLGVWAEDNRSLAVPLIQLVTWNDYAETTTLEPTRDYGTEPLARCLGNLREAQDIWRFADAGW